ncbi:DUF5412 family protein [Clostridium gasigenes]|nr:DUF5412 family protein [Clostridium gasigenes]
MYRNRFEDKKVKKINSPIMSKVKKVVISVLIILVVILGGLVISIETLRYMFKPSEEFITSSESSDGKYKVEAYLINGGMTTDWAVRGYLTTNGKKKKKSIYNDYHVNKAIITWVDEDTIKINGHEIDLPNGRYSFQDEE